MKSIREDFQSAIIGCELMHNNSEIVAIEQSVPTGPAATYPLMVLPYYLSHRSLYLSTMTSWRPKNTYQDGSQAFNTNFDCFQESYQQNQTTSIL